MVEQKSDQNILDKAAGTSLKIDFTTFLLSIGSAAFMGLGMAPRPDSEKKEIDLGLARQNIDLLELMKDKTKSNLTTDEEKLLDHLLFETRMRFVEIQKSNLQKS